MDFIKRLIRLAAIFVIAVFAFGFFLPKKIIIERSIEINAPVDTVFENVSDFKKFILWTPWREIDPDWEVTYSGEMGQVGSEYKWRGDENVGVGSMKITEIEKNRIDIDMNIVEPWKTTAKIYFKIDSVDNATHVTWGYFEKTPVPKNVSTLFFRVKKMLSKKFDDGLLDLKQLSEGK